MNVITLCGSIKFKDEFMKVQEKLTLEGNIVLTPNFFNSIRKEEITLETKKMLDEMPVSYTHLDVYKRQIHLFDDTYLYYQES